MVFCPPRERVHNMHIQKIQKLATLRKVLVSILLCLSLLTFSAQSAKADDSSLEAAIPQIRANLAEYGVSIATQDSLIKKLQAGELWDSLKGSVVPSATKKYLNNANERVTVNTFPDGSIDVASIQLASKASNTGQRSVSNCQMPDGTPMTGVATGCKFLWTGILFQLAWTFDYRYHATGSDASYVRYYNLRAFQLIGAISDLHFTEINNRDVQGWATYTAPSDIASLTGGAGLRLNGLNDFEEYRVQF